MLKSFLIWDEFVKYCKLNGIDNPDAYGEKLFTDAFNVLKYGKTPSKIKGDQPVEVSRPTHQETQGKAEGEQTQTNTKANPTKAVEIINNSDIYDD
jgi:hypothetical protein